MSTRKKVAVVTDGACSMTPAQALPYGVYVAPVYVTFGDKTYQAGVDLESSEFYRLLSASKRLPTTAQPTAADFLKLYDKLAEEADEILTIVISHHMSATLQSAETAKAQFTKAPVHIIDSESVSLGLGMMAIAAAQAAAAGHDSQAVIRLVENIKQRINVYFTVNTLEYLYKGGRIGGATALLGSVLDIKPVLYISNGRIEPFERQRTRKRSIARLLEILEEKVGDGAAHIAVLHGNIPDEAHDLEQQIRGKFNCVELITSEMGPVIGVHAGPGTLGLVFYTDLGNDF